MMTYINVTNTTFTSKFLSVWHTIQIQAYAKVPYREGNSQTKGGSWPFSKPFIKLYFLSFKVLNKEVELVEHLRQLPDSKCDAEG